MIDYSIATGDFIVDKTIKEQGSVVIIEIMRESIRFVIILFKK